jgi:TBC1 domain family member 5
VLFSREFHIDDVRVLWDSLFAHGYKHTLQENKKQRGKGRERETRQSTGDRDEYCSPLTLTHSSFPLIDYISISMYLYVRKALITGDNSSCLRRLLKYPPVEDVR